MIKYFGMVKRKDGLTREQFLHHWKEIHGPLFASKNVPGLRKYIQNWPAQVTKPELDTDIDGIVELWFDDLESAQAFPQWLRSDEGKECREGMKLFVNTEEISAFFGEEHVLKEC